jgi:hypothetical protein
MEAVDVLSANTNAALRRCRRGTSAKTSKSDRLEALGVGAASGCARKYRMYALPTSMQRKAEESRSLKAKCAKQI